MYCKDESPQNGSGTWMFLSPWCSRLGQGVSARGSGPVDVFMLALVAPEVSLSPEAAAQLPLPMSSEAKREGS